MALTESFYEAVSSGNVRRVRIMMKDSLLVDPTFAQFEQMEIAASSLAELFLQTMFPLLRLIRSKSRQIRQKGQFV